MRYEAMSSATINVSETLDRAIWHCDYFFKQVGLAKNSVADLDSMFMDLFSIVLCVKGVAPYWEIICSDWLRRRPYLIARELSLVKETQEMVR